MAPTGRGRGCPTSAPTRSTRGLTACRRPSRCPSRSSGATRRGAKAETGVLATMSGGGPGGRGAPPPAWPHDQAPLHAQLPRELLGPLPPRPVVVHPQAHLVEPLAGQDLGGGRPAPVRQARGRPAHGLAHSHGVELAFGHDEGRRFGGDASLRPTMTTGTTPQPQCGREQGRCEHIPPLVCIFVPPTLVPDPPFPAIVPFPWPARRPARVRQDPDSQGHLQAAEEDPLRRDGWRPGDHGVGGQEESRRGA